jgi:hypothetical protein
MNGRTESVVGRLVRSIGRTDPIFKPESRIPRSLVGQFLLALVTPASTQLTARIQATEAFGAADHKQTVWSRPSQDGPIQLSSDELAMTTDSQVVLDEGRDSGSEPNPGDPETDPVRLVRPLRRFDFAATRPSAANIALVLLAADGSTSTYRYRRPTLGELLGFRTLFEIDLAYHRVFLKFQVPSQNDIPFETEVAVVWSVMKPEIIVRRGVRDVRALLAPTLRALIARKAQQFALSDIAVAEDAVNSMLANAKDVEEFGLQVTCSVRLARTADAGGLVGVARLARNLYYEAALRDDDMLMLNLLTDAALINLVREGRTPGQLESLASQIELIRGLLDADLVEDPGLEEALMKLLARLQATQAEAFKTARAKAAGTNPPVSEDQPAPDANDDNAM